LIGIGQAFWSTEKEATLVARSIGSSAALALYDPVARAGGILHWMLPESGIDPARAMRNPSLFADTGIPHLLEGLAKMGVKRENLRAYLVGAASLSKAGLIDVGARNRAGAYQSLRNNGISLTEEAIGGATVREVVLEIGSGRCRIRSQTL
jgi:chemotaxis protein CheD